MIKFNHLHKRFFPLSITFFATLLISIAGNTVEIPEDRSNKKIAFLFLTRGPLPLEDIWREFFRWRGNSSLFTVYAHPHHGYRYPSTSFFHGKEVHSDVGKVKWGGLSQVRAMKNLVRAALEDPLNEWFCLMSESCIPLVPFPKWRNVMLANNKSIVNACPMHPSEMETDSRWKPSLDKVGMNKSHWRKSANWFGLTRKHAYVFVNETKLEPGWDGVTCCDEHYLPSILAYYGLDNETTCTDGLAHVNWPSLVAMHPKTYNSDEINAELFAYFERPVGDHAGFSQQCSGFPQLCHFTARKFGPHSKYTLLENLDLILSDEEHPYIGNPWDHHQDKLRVNHTTNGSIYYLIENGILREVPDNFTLTTFHLKLSGDIARLTAEDKLKYPTGNPFPSRKDGSLLKLPKRLQLWLVKNGRRHAIPNMDTFNSIRPPVFLKDIITLPESDMEQIPLGPPIPNVNTAGKI